MPEKYNGYWQYEITLEVSDMAFEGNEVWTLDKGVIAAATQPVAEAIAKMLVPLALEDNRVRIEDELNWTPTPDDEDLSVSVVPFEQPTPHELAQETIAQLERANTLAVENAEEQT